MCTPRGDLVNRPSCTSTTTSTYLTPRPPCRPSDHRSDATSPTAESELSLEEHCGGRCCPDLSPMWCGGCGNRKFGRAARSPRGPGQGGTARGGGSAGGSVSLLSRPVPRGSSSKSQVPSGYGDGVGRGAAEGAHRCVDADSGCGHSGHPDSCCESPGSGATSAFSGPAERRPDFKVHPKRTNADTSRCSAESQRLRCGRALGAYSYQRPVQNGHHRKHSGHIDKL